MSMKKILEWEGFSFDTEYPCKDVVIFVDIYGNLKVMSKNTFNMITVTTYCDNGSIRYIISDSEGKILARVCDLNMVINQLFQ